jgi:hypothetical protein
MRRHSLLPAPALLLISCLSGNPVLAAEVQESERPLEYKVKAAFLYNFAKFVEWPDRVFPDQTSPIRICILGDDAFAGVVERTVHGETLNRRSLVVHRARPDPPRDCQILFVSKSAESYFHALLDRARNLPVLTVGEHDSFCPAGGILNFYLADGKVRFEVNMNALDVSQLRISSKLLRLARIVRPPKQGSN